MANQPNPASKPAANAARAAAPGFPTRGVPIFGTFNRLGLWTLYMKEVRRFFKVQTQTIWAPAITTLLYLMISPSPSGATGAK